MTQDTGLIQPAPAAPPTLLRLFFGDEGLRAGWSLLVYLLLAALFVFVFGRLASRLHLLPTLAPHAPQTARVTGIAESIGLCAFILAATIMSRIERRPFTRYGLAPTRLLPHLLAGLAWGLVLLSTLVATLVLTHHLVFDVRLLHGIPALFFGLQWALAFFLVGLQEEFVTRGYIQFTLTRGIAGLTRALNPNASDTRAIGFWVAALIFSVLLFMALHLLNPGETPAGILAVGLAGLTFAFSLWRTGSLWWAIGFHTAWDWAQSFLFGVPDSGTIVANHLYATHPLGLSLLSGGSAGPEGSLFVLPTLLLACLAVHLTYPRRRALCAPFIATG